jgi:hypothetical protein
MPGFALGYAEANVTDWAMKSDWHVATGLVSFIVFPRGPLA